MASLTELSMNMLVDQIKKLPPLLLEQVLGVTRKKLKEEIREEVEDEVAPEEVDAGLEALANKHGWSKVIDAVTRLAKKP